MGKTWRKDGWETINQSQTQRQQRRNSHRQPLEIDIHLTHFLPNARQEAAAENETLRWKSNRTDFHRANGDRS